MKYQITNDQLKELLELQKECTDALGECSKLGIEAEGMKLRIPQEWALLNMVFDILGLPQEGFTRFRKENPKLSNPELCEQFQKHMDNEPYSFCRDTLISDCFKHLDESGTDKCLEYMVKSVQEWKEASKCP